MFGKAVAFLSLILSVVLVTGTAKAQDDWKNEIGLLLGGPITPSLQLNGGGKIDIGSGLTYQATYARRLLDGQTAALYIEVPLLAIPQQNVSSTSGTIPANYASLFITPGLRVKFAPQAALSPWFSVGGGYANFDVSKRLLNGDPNLGRTTVNRGAAQFGGGVDIRTPIKVLFPIGLRVEVRDIYSGKPNYNADTGSGFQHNVVFSGGFTVHF